MEIESDESIDLINISSEILSNYPSKKTLINSLHVLLSQFESHLDSIIKKYKVMTITLLLATGAAIGFSFSEDLKDLQINKLIMTSTVCFFGIMSITAMWYIDVQVFHKFWGSFFIEEVKMEAKYPFLVDIGNMSVSLDNIKARLIGDGNFYIFLNIILITMIAIILSFLSNSIMIKGIIFAVGACIILFVMKLMRRLNMKLLYVVEQLLK